jgi:dephospho-CoA kinase
MPSDPVPLVGVTGGIGSGKTAVCKCFEVLGRTVVSADLLARELTEKDVAVRQAIQEEFGAAIYGADGALRRKDLAAIVFADRTRLRALNAIVHPRVFAAIERTVGSLPASRRIPFVIVEAALVFESGLDKHLVATVVVRAAEETRIARVSARDGSPRDGIIARMRAQLPAEEQAKRADFVIDNEGPENGLFAKVKFIDTVLRAMLQGAPHRGMISRGALA